MKHVYIAHPLNAPTRAGIEENLRTASKWVAWAAHQGVCPIATWIVLAGEWEETPENRALGLEVDKAAIERCDELWLVGSRVSTGMEIEAKHALACGIPVRNKLTEDGLP